MDFCSLNNNWKEIDQHSSFMRMKFGLVSWQLVPQPHCHRLVVWYELLPPSKHICKRCNYPNRIIIVPHTAQISLNLPQVEANGHWVNSEIIQVSGRQRGNHHPPILLCRRQHVGVLLEPVARILIQYVNGDLSHVAESQAAANVNWVF